MFNTMSLYFRFIMANVRPKLLFSCSVAFFSGLGHCRHGARAQQLTYISFAIIVYVF